MLTKGYKATEKYMMIRASKESLMEELNYNNISSVYKLFSKLSALGLIKLHKKSIYTLYFKSFKVTELYQDMDIPKVQELELKAAVGEQCTIDNIISSKKFMNGSDKSSEDIKRTNQPINISDDLKYRIGKDVLIDEYLESFMQENIKYLQKYENLSIENGSEVGNVLLEI